MIIPDKIKEFLSEIADVSLGNNEINFFQIESLEEEQMGYSVDTKGDSLVTGNDSDWQEKWIVIASDQMGDPVIVDFGNPDFKVLTAAHGEGIWQPVVIADSLDDFKKVIVTLNNISKNRDNPVNMEKNPISNREKRKALKQIKEQNPNSDSSYWENFLEEA